MPHMHREGGKLHCNYTCDKAGCIHHELVAEPPCNVKVMVTASKDVAATLARHVVSQLEKHPAIAPMPSL